MSDNKTYNSRTADKFVVRLPYGLRDKLAEMSRNGHRSMNSTIVKMLQDAASSTLPEIPWVPQIGQLVTYKDKPYRLSNFVYVDGEVQGYIKGLIPQSHDHVVPPYYLEKSVSLVDLIPYKI